MLRQQRLQSECSSGLNDRLMRCTATTSSRISAQGDLDSLGKVRRALYSIGDALVKINCRVLGGALDTVLNDMPISVSATRIPPSFLVRRL